MRPSITARLSVSDLYDPLLRLCVDFVDDLHGRGVSKETRHLVDAHTLAKKTVLHLISMHRLYSAVPTRDYITHMRDGTSGPIDHASGSVLLRTAYEAYLTLSFLYMGENNANREIRHVSWQIGALSYRQRLDPITSSDAQKKIVEAERLVHLTQRLRENAHFIALNHRARSKLEAGIWDYGLSWIDLAEAAGFEKTWFRKVYGYLCAYAHSGYLTAMQIGTASQASEQERLATFNLRMALPLLAKFILRYPTLFPQAAEIRNCNPFAFRAAMRLDMSPRDVDESPR